MKKQIHHKRGVQGANFIELGSDGEFAVPDFLNGQADIKKEPKGQRRAVARERRRLEWARRREQKEMSIAERIQEEWKLPRKRFGAVHLVAVGIVGVAAAFVIGAGVFDKYLVVRDTAVVAAFVGVPEVSEEPISVQAKMDYKVPRGEPRYIRIGALNIDARVQSVGRTESGQMAVASNIFDAAWFSESAKPGSKGAVVVNGHLSGPTQDGIFAKVARLKAGDEIVVERGDTTKFSYEVRKVETMRLEDVAASRLFQVVDGEEQGLNLVTYSGQYERNSDGYSDRTIVYAVLKRKI